MLVKDFEHKDIDYLSLLQPTDWSDIRPAFELYTTANFCFPLKIVKGEEIVGIGATIVHEDIAWLGHIIVHTAHRNQGIGRLITDTLLENALSIGCETIYLIATDLGAPVYEKAGFETETDYLFYKDIIPAGNWNKPGHIIPYSLEYEEQVAELDKNTSGENRFFHLKNYLPGGYLFVRNKRVEGFYLPTFGEGIIIASNPEAGSELMKLRFTAKDHAAFPVENKTAAALLQQWNYAPFKTAKRMRWGKQREWQPQYLFNRIAGNIG